MRNPWRAGSEAASWIPAECDLAVRGVLDGLRTAALLGDDGNYRDSNQRRLAPAELLAMAQAEGNSLTYTCLPPGSGRRIALDLL